MDLPVYLGEMRTDADQRLTGAGGRGAAGSYDDSAAITFANNEGWHDDVSDGPVTATVRLHGEPLEVVPAWVVVAPPNYGPQRKSVRTMWDVMRDVAINANMLPAPDRPSFTDDILPLFQRLVGLQWVNAAYAAGFGWLGTFDLTSEGALRQLSSADPACREQRRIIANNFRNFSRDSNSPIPWPWLYGDAMSIPPAPTPRQNASLSECQLSMLESWAEGNFEEDWSPSYNPPRTIEEVPVAKQGDMLTRAALEFCLADAFHPGCEMTLAGPGAGDVHGALPLPARSSGLGRVDPAHDTDARCRDHTERTAVRSGTRRDHPLDGGALADRHGELPFGLHTLLRPVRTGLLARARF